MKYRYLGRSGLLVSRLCLGTMTFGNSQWGCDQTTSSAIVDAFIAGGGNFIDTADMYSAGESEKMLGIALKSHDRDSLVIASKCWFPSGNAVTARGLSRKHIVEACEASLRRLKTDYIDLYWLHVWDTTTPIEETYRALDTLVEQGKVRYLGFSDTPAWKCAQAQTLAHFRGYSPLVALQIEYSLLQRTVEGELVPMARELGLGITPWSPLKSGALSGKYRREDHGNHKAGRGAWATSALDDKTYAVLDVLADIAKELGTTIPRVAIAWVQGRAGVASTIIGARTMAQLEDNLAALEVTLTAAHVEKLDAVSKPSLPFPCDFVANSPAFYFGGTTIDGKSAPVWPMAPKDDADRY